MKHTFKKGLSWLLALVMCLGTLSGLSITADGATYSPIANWGQRGKVATELSEMAISFYESNGTDYTELSTLSGASSISDVPSSELYIELKSLMESNHTSKTNYEEIKDLCKYTDCENSNTGSMTCLYCGTTVSAEWDKAATWNREHTWPKSKSLNGDTWSESSRSDETDIVMLRPTCPNENSSRGNKAYGSTTNSNYYNPNLGSQNVHGDMARSLLFGYVRWGNTTYMWGSDGVIESKETLIEWMQEDPVDTWELGRNDVIESITGTRNVFVDYPELAFKLFEEDVPTDYTTPSGEGAATNYTINAYSSNSTYGTVSVSGTTITASPKDGYCVTGYTVTSGTATVTQSGNTFKVSASSDCTVQINFAAKTAVTLIFMENGQTGSTINSYRGDTITLPQPTVSVDAEYSFLGWTDTTVTDTTDKPMIYTAGSSYTAASKTFYAVYTYSVGGTGVAEYVLTDLANITANDVFVITSTSGSTVYALPNDAVSKGPEAVTVTVSGDKLTAEPSDNLKWNLGGSTDAWIFYPDGITSRWLNSTNDNNGMSVGIGTNNTYKINSNYLYNIGTSRYVGVYTNNPDWRCYTTSSGNIANQTLGFYVKTESGTAYYTTSAVTCDHEDITEVAEVAATCSQTGFSAGVYCNDCNTYISGHEVTPMTDHENIELIPEVAPSCTEDGLSDGIYCNDCQSVVVEQEVVAATGHSYEGVVTKPTETEQGYTTYTCTVCSDSYVGDYTEATGEIFTVSFWVPDGVANVAAMECGKDGIALPTAGAPDGYSFAGWALESVEDTEVAPTIYTANSTYTATANTDLFAVYTYVTDGTSNSQYVKVTEAPADWSGEYLIVYEAGGLIFDGSLETLDAVSNYQTVTITDNTIPADGNTAYQFVIEKTDSGYSIRSAGGYYIGATGNSNSLNASTSTVYTNTLSLDADGNANIIGSGGAYLRYNFSSNQMRFRYYKSSTYTGQKAVALYVLTEDGVTHYTSLGSTKTVAAAVYSGASLVREYASFEDAMAMCDPDTEYIRLLADVTVAGIELPDDLYIDLNGFDFGGTVNMDGYAIYGMDSTTNSYNGDSVGYFTAVDYYTGEPIVPQRHIKTNITGSVKRYMAVKSDAGYSFHRFYMGITHATVKPGTVGVGYKAIFAGDDAVKAQLGSYGFELQLSGFDAVTAMNTADSFVSGKTVSVRVENYNVEDYGETALSAKVVMVLADGTEIESAPVSMSLRNMVEKMNTNSGTYTATQLAALREMLDKFSSTTGWTTENIK